MARFAAGTTSSDNTSTEEASRLQFHKINLLRQNLVGYHNLIQNVLAYFTNNLLLFLDDFYFIERQYQPYVLDYLHSLSKGSNLYLKIGTIRYRTTLLQYDKKTSQPIGMEPSHDILPIDLDYSLDNLTAMSGVLDEILDIYAAKAGLQMSDIDHLFTAGGKKMLHIASGGVPRDFLNLFVRSQDIARRSKLIKLEKKVIGEAAKQYLDTTKRSNLSEDSTNDSNKLEELIERIRQFAIETKRSTVILVKEDESSEHPEEYERLKQLMDFRFLHLVDQSTSATYGDRKRYEAYMLDAGLWAAPRATNLVEVDFETADEKGRKDQIRNSPKFQLS